MPRWPPASCSTKPGARGRSTREPVRFQPRPAIPIRSGQKRPLAERMRPDTLDDFAGQEHILGPGKPLRRQIERDELTS
jgi:hypothetical protein